MMETQNSSPKQETKFTTDLSQILGAQQSKIMVARFDKDGYFQSAWMSKDLEKMYGLRSKDFEGKHLKDFYSASDAQRKLEYLRRSLELKATVKEASHFSTKLGEFWLDITHIPAGSPKIPYVISISKDITDIRSLEFKNKDSMTHHLKHKEDDVYGFLMCDENGNLLEANERLAEILGDDSPTSLIARVQHIRQLIQPDDENADRFWSLFAKPSSQQTLVVGILHKNGKPIQLKMGKTTGFNPEISSKNLVYLFFKDLDASNKFVTTERSDIEFFKGVLGGLSDVHIDIFNREGRMIAAWWPEAMILGGKGFIVLPKAGRTLYQVLPEEEAKRKISLINDVLNTGLPLKEEFHFGKQYSNSWWEKTISPIRLSSGEEYAMVMGRDITDRKRAEEERLQLERQLLHGQKMEAIGRIAAGIAHDFGNRLSVILGYGTYLKTFLNGDENVTGRLEKLIQATEQAADLTKQLLLFSQKDVRQNTLVNIHCQLQDSLDIFEHSLDKRIKLIREFSAKHCNVIADENHIQNVFFNLILNAADSMDEGGKLTISTENRILSGKEPELAAFTIHEGEHLCITVADTGKGMDANELSRIFEPFYTTKPMTGGTGLGLSSVYGTVTRCKGAITVESEVGKGSTFCIFLPVSGSAEAQKTISIDPAEIVPGNGSIFIVDDEKAVREMMADCLRLAGYTVTVCGDAIEAIKFIRQQPRSPDLVLLDLMMPVLSGEQVYATMRKIDPTIKVLIVSAYGQSGMIQNVLDGGALGVVEKPISAAGLTQAVADALK